MEEKFSYNDFVKISQSLHSVIKIDTRLTDQDGKILFQLTNHSIPVILEQPDNEYTHINEILRKNQPNHFYHYINRFGLEYVAVGIWRSQSFHGSILVGPLITSISIIDLIKDIISKNKLPIGERRQLEEFYQSLPTLSDTECQNIGELLVNMCNHDYINSHPIPSNTRQPALNQGMNIKENEHVIESRYEHQNKLMHAIAKGDKTEANQLINSMSAILVFSNRIPESPIRSSKNIAFVSNTLFRVAAEKSGVHPVYLHNISERFAILIERTTNIPNLKKLIVLMANEYCDLVLTFSTGQYSEIVKKAVDYILLNLGEESLSLNQIANQIHANPSHLSRKFKQDTGMSTTDFINQKRVDEAKLYLQRGNISVTEIAFMVGFNDLNYFSKVFKKLTSVTPSQWKQQGENPTNF